MKLDGPLTGDGQFPRIALYVQVAGTSDANLIDEVLKKKKKDGFSFSTAGNKANGFTVNADPVNTSTGMRHFYSDKTAVIRYAKGGSADPGSSPLDH